MRRIYLIGMIAILSGCRSRTSAPIAISCDTTALRVTFTPDSAAALCLPPSYQAREGSRLWARGTVEDAGYAWLSVAVLDSSAAADEWGVPPQPRSFRRRDPPGVLHAITAESVTVHREVVETRPVDVEIALISGGAMGASRQPALRAAWPLEGGRWVLVQGQSANPAMLDSLRGLLRTIRTASKP